MKKTLMSLFTIGTIAVVAYAGTTAFFSDEETSTGNTFQAGAIDLLVDSQAHYNGMVCTDGIWVAEDPQVTPAPGQYPVAGAPCTGTWASTDLNTLTSSAFFNYSDLKPGDHGENTISLHVNNNDAYMCAVIDNMNDDDLGLTEPEQEAGDNTDGLSNGELAPEMRFFAWSDDGNNIWEQGETPLFSNTEGPASDVLDGISYPMFTPQTGVFPGGADRYIGLFWCYGDIDTSNNTLSCNGSSVTNLSQTDRLTADISFYVEQARNNPDFTCPQPENSRRMVVTQADLATTVNDLIADPFSWLFYNDTNDTIMTIDQFAATGGANRMDTIAGIAGAYMLLDNGTQSPDYDGPNDAGNPRYNIATYKYKDVKLADISSLNYRIFDGSVSAETPYLHFNVDFVNDDTWQRRLVQVPTGVVANTWTNVDALAGSWTYSGPTWPAGLIDNTGITPGTTPRTWADILANYPNAETRSTDSFFGVRVGHPGPLGETGYVDWIEFNGETTDFVL